MTLVVSENICYKNCRVLTNQGWQHSSAQFALQAELETLQKELETEQDLVGLWKWVIKMSELG